MGKRKKKYTGIQELRENRDGGQIALRGYSYQFLYSCYLLLKETDPNAVYQLEGIEDIDRIEQINGNEITTHIQLKYSIKRQDASFLTDVLENFLEAYLIDQSRSFKLVYDFQMAEGHLKNIITGSLNKSSRNHWITKIKEIQNKHPQWDWAVYDFDRFIGTITFENVTKDNLAAQIENELIRSYELTTDNLSLFANSIKILCFTKMEQRGFVAKSDIAHVIRQVKIDISKGPQNPAHSWIRKLNFARSARENSDGFFEGKRATATDIADELPVERPRLERTVKNSISSHAVTVIKASSGQGKTTLALRSAYLLQTDYVAYQLQYCNDVKSIGDSVQFFKARIQLGEKVLILLDNLDNRFCQWNILVQQLQNELPCHYKLLITAREDDWYTFAGDLSKIQSLNIIKPVLDEAEAKEIFMLFKAALKLHPSIVDWRKAWNKISERQLLIEYVYLLTHGEMLSERIDSQISEIARSPLGQAKCEILRKVCFADTCGVRLPVMKLYECQEQWNGADYGELLKSMESEFLVHVHEEGVYIEGLHPVRSKHVLDRLHEYLPIDRTALSVIRMVDKVDLPYLFAHCPEYTLSLNCFFKDVIEILWNPLDLSDYYAAIKGLFSGCVNVYFRENSKFFDDANKHGGLFMLSTDVCPFISYDEFDVSIRPLDKTREIMPDNPNIKYLCSLRDQMPTYKLQDTYIHVFCGFLFRKLAACSICDIHDLSSYASIAEWLISIDQSFNLCEFFTLEQIWQHPELFSIDSMASLMYVSFCGNKNTFKAFTDSHIKGILTYLKHQTSSQKLYIEEDRNAIHVEYILHSDNYNSANDESVSRLKLICKALPIFGLYCADAYKPKFDILESYPVPDDAHKEMPINNVVIMFRQNIASLWNKTIMSNYEFDTVPEWLDHWYALRSIVCALNEKYCALMYKILGAKRVAGERNEIDNLYAQYNNQSIIECRFPKEDRPFDERAEILDGLSAIRQNYFQSLHNFMNQFVKFIQRDEHTQRLAMINLTSAQNSLSQMQEYFSLIASDFGYTPQSIDLCYQENLSLSYLKMCCEYYIARMPNAHFRKYDIKPWYDEHCQDIRKSAENTLKGLADEYSVHFPYHTYSSGILSYYPIIIEGLTETLISNPADWIQRLIPFAKAPFDYLVVLLLDVSNKIMNHALLFSKSLFTELYDLTNGKESASTRITPPCPIAVTEQMIECFAHEYSLVDQIDDYGTMQCVTDIAEALWAYSKNRELLSEPEDSEYLANTQHRIVELVKNKMLALGKVLHTEMVSWLEDRIREVYSGKTCNDVMFNSIIHHYSNFQK